MNTRRNFLKTFSLLPVLAYIPQLANAEGLSDFSKLKNGYSLRLKKILASGELPYIDLESSCKSRSLDIDWFAGKMDQFNIGLTALSADIGSRQFEDGVRFDNLSQQLLDKYPDRFIPVGNGGQPPLLTEATDEFLGLQETEAMEKRIVLFGEYEFRHYPSPRQVKRGQTERDVQIPIDGPVGHHLFAISEKTGIPFQIHYEIEDTLLPALEYMLAKYPKAKVIWCHFAQIRYIERASSYTPEYVASLINRFPNLYFDTAFGDASSIYPLSNQHQARVWSESGALKTEWRNLIVAHSSRFLSALDLGGDRIDQFAEYNIKHRNLLKLLPPETQHQIAYRNAWSLLFQEEFV